MSGENEVCERRRRQRFLGCRGGQPFFWVAVAGERLPVLDLSLEGFAMPAQTPAQTERVFEFALKCEGESGEVRGRARVVNYVGSASGGQAGCFFDTFEGDGAERLQAWLRRYILENAWVPISEREADAIVSGPSLV